MTNPTPQSVYTRGSGTTSTAPFITLIWDRAPTANDINFQVTQRIVDTSSNNDEYFLLGFTAALGVISANWVLLSDNTSFVETLTGNSGGAVSVDANRNINILGSDTTTVVGTPLNNTLTITTLAGGYPITPYVVGPLGQAGYQTIQSAINAATSDGGGIVYIQPGTYTENVTIGVNINLVGLIGTSGNTFLTSDGGETPPVQIVGNVTIDVTAAVATPTTELKWIGFSCISGDLFTITGNIGLVESGFITFDGCYLLANAGSDVIFNVNGFFNINFIESVITEATPNTNDLFQFGATAFCNLSARDSVIAINAENANILPDSSFIEMNLENCFYSARMDLSGGSSSFFLNVVNSFISFDGASPGDALIVFGANDGFVNAQNCIIDEASGSLGNSTSVDPASFFTYTLCTFNNPIVLGATGRGDFYHCDIFGGSSAAVTMSSSEDVSFTSCLLSSSNNPCVAGAGAGTITLADITFSGNAILAGTLTLGTTPRFLPKVMTNGQLLIGSNNQASVASTLTAGSNINILNAAGAITISADAGDLVFIQTQSASSGPWITFTTLSASYSTYLIRISNAQPAAATVTNPSLHMEVSADGGSSWIVTGYVSSVGSIYSDTAIGAFASTSDFPIDVGQENGTPANYTIWMNETNTGNLPSINGSGWSTVSDPAHPGGGSDSFGGYVSTPNINAFRVGFNTGDIASMTISLYGLVT